MSRRKTTEEFVAQAIQKYGDQFDYSPTIYIKNDAKVEIKCNKHNFVFSQTPSNHLSFNGCPNCREASQRQRFQKSTEKFIQQAHNRKKGLLTKYDYSKSIYKNNHDKITVICPFHGEFLTIPSQHLNGVDCPKCAIKKLPGGYFNKFFDRNPQKITQPSTLYFLKFTNRKTENTFFKLGITTQNTTRRFAGPAYNIFQIDTIWESTGPLRIVHALEIAIKRIYNNHRITVDYHKFHGFTECFDCEVPKCVIPTNILDTDIKHLDITTSRILIKSNIIEHRIFARDTICQTITSKIVNDFYNSSHSQGETTRGTYNIGLFHNEILVSAMSFGTPRYTSKYEYELLRFAIAKHTVVLGGASKLFQHFLNDQHPVSIISYSDIRWGIGEVYLKMGFVKSHKSNPNYWYVKDQEKLSRIKCQKHKLSKLLGEQFDPNKSESENMFLAGYKKVFDLGQDVFIWTAQTKVQSA